MPELVLLFVEREVRPVGGQVQLVVGLRALGDVLAVEEAGDEVGRHRVRDRDEVRPRRVERVEERPGLADQAPAIAAGVDLLAAIGEVRNLEEVLDLVEPGLDRIGDLGLVAAEPVDQALERVELLEGVEPRVGAEADGDRPRRELDQPHPVALPAHVVGAELAHAALRHAAEELLVVGVGPVLEVEPPGETEPR